MQKGHKKTKVNAWLWLTLLKLDYEVHFQNAINPTFGKALVAWNVYEIQSIDGVRGSVKLMTNHIRSESGRKLGYGPKLLTKMSSGLALNFRQQQQETKTKTLLYLWRYWERFWRKMGPPCPQSTRSRLCCFQRTHVKNVQILHVGALRANW